MSKQDRLDLNLKKLFNSCEPELRLPEAKRRGILATLVRQSCVPRLRGRRKLLRRIDALGSWGKLAAAVLLIVAVTVVALLSIHAIREQGRSARVRQEAGYNDMKDEGEQYSREIVVEKPGQQRELAAELRRVQEMYVSGDIDGLVKILEEGTFSGKVLAAEYLAKIGDARALPALEKLFLSTRGDLPAGYDQDPFETAIEAIRRRLEQLIVDANNEPDVSSKAESSDNIAYVGVVTDEDGRPLQAVGVRSALIWNNADLWVRELLKKVEGSVTTDSQGRYRMEVPPLENEGWLCRMLVFEHPKYALCWCTATKDLYIRLFPSTIVSGTVVDEQGNPVQGAALSARLRAESRYGYTNRGSGVCCLIAVTGVDGKFKIEKVPEGARLHVDVLKKGYARYSTQSYGSNAFPIRAGSTDLLITLRPGGLIQGRLVLDGKPYRRDGIVVKACVTGSRAEGCAVTNENGEFEIIGLPTEHSYSVIVANRYSVGADLVCRPFENVRVGPDQEWYVELELQNGQPVTVEIVDEQTGQPVSNHFFSIALFDPNRGSGKPVNIRIASGRTGMTGRSVVNLTPNYYRIRTKSWTQGRYRDTEEYFQVTAEQSHLNLTIAVTTEPMIRGWLVDIEGRSIHGYVCRPDKYATDQEGRFEVPQPSSDSGGSGHICYAFDAAGGLGYVFTWESQEDVDALRIVLEPLVTIVGRVVDPNGVAVSHVEPHLWFSGRDGHWRGLSSILRSEISVQVDADGYFAIERVPVGLPIAVHPTAPYGGRPSVDLGQLEPGRVVDVGNIVVEERFLKQLREAEERALKKLREMEEIEWNATLSGQVSDADGNAVVGARISTKYGEKYFQDWTDINGKYKLTGLPKGKKISLRASLTSPSYPATDYEVVCDGNDFDIQFAPRK